MSTVFMSFDIESDGNNPLQHSMLSLGIAAFVEEQGVIDTFYVTLLPQKDANNQDFLPSACTMETFWKFYPRHWNEIVNSNRFSPSQAMESLSEWLQKHSKTSSIKWVARPSNFDWMWLKCYYEKYGPLEKPDIGFYCHDLSSLLRAYCLTHNIQDKKKFQLILAGRYKYTHNALADALCQGNMYMNLRKLLMRKLPTHIEYLPEGGVRVTYAFNQNPNAVRDEDFDDSHCAFDQLKQ